MLDKGMDRIRFQTTRFGDLEVDSSAVIDIYAGIICFPKFRSYVLIEHSNPFAWLQSIENPDLAFVVVNSVEFGEAYQFDIPFDDPELGLTENSEIALLNVVTLRADSSESTVNLKAPIVVNLSNPKGRQIVLDDQRYPTRMKLWAEDTPEDKSPEQSQEENK